MTISYWQYSYGTKSTYINDYKTNKILILSRGKLKQNSYPCKDDIIHITHMAKLRVVGIVLYTIDDEIIIRLIQVFSKKEAQRQIGFRRPWVKLKF